MSLAPGGLGKEGWNGIKIAPSAWRREGRGRGRGGEIHLCLVRHSFSTTGLAASFELHKADVLYPSSALLLSSNLTPFMADQGADTWLAICEASHGRAKSMASRLTMQNTIPNSSWRYSTTQEIKITFLPSKNMRCASLSR